MASSHTPRSGRLPDIETLKANAKSSGLPSKKTTAAEALQLALGLVAQVATYAPVPYLKQAASTAVTLIQVAQTVSDNMEDLKVLAKDAAELVAAIARSCKASEDPEKWMTSEMKYGLEQLNAALGNIARAAKELSGASAFQRVMRSKSYAETISNMRNQLDTCIATFEAIICSSIQSHLSIHRELLRVQEQQKEVFEASRLKTYASEPNVKRAVKPRAIPKRTVTLDTHPAASNISQTDDKASSKKKSGKSKIAVRKPRRGNGDLDVDERDTSGRSGSEGEVEAEDRKGKQKSDRKTNKGKNPARRRAKEELHDGLRKLNMGFSQVPQPQDFNYGQYYYGHNHPAPGADPAQRGHPTTAQPYYQPYAMYDPPPPANYYAPPHTRLVSSPACFGLGGSDLGQTLNGQVSDLVENIFSQVGAELGQKDASATRNARMTSSARLAAKSKKARTTRESKEKNANGHDDDDDDDDDDDEDWSNDDSDDSSEEEVQMKPRPPRRARK